MMISQFSVGAIGGPASESVKHLSCLLTGYVGTLRGQPVKPHDVRAYLRVCATHLL